MGDLMRTVIAQEVRRQFDEQKEELHEELFQGCDRNDTLEEICAKMVTNGVYASTRLAAEMTIGLLLESGKFTPHSDDELRRRILLACNRKDE